MATLKKRPQSGMSSASAAGNPAAVADTVVSPESGIGALDRRGVGSVSS